MVTVRLSLVRRNGVTAGAFSFDYNPGLVAEIKATQPARARWWDKELKVWFVESNKVDELVARLETSSGGHVVQVRRDAALGRRIADAWRTGVGTAWPKTFGGPGPHAAGDAPGGARAPAAGPSSGRGENAAPGANGAVPRPQFDPPACACGEWSPGMVHRGACPRYAYAARVFGGWACQGCLKPRTEPCEPKCALRCKCEQWRRDKNQHADGCPRNPVQEPPGPRFNGFEDFFRAHRVRFTKGGGFAPGFRFDFRGEEPRQARRVRQEVASAADYAKLGLQPGASFEAVKAAHRRIALENHPDRGGDVEVLKAVNVAVDRIKFTIGLDA